MTLPLRSEASASWRTHRRKTPVTFLAILTMAIVFAVVVVSTGAAAAQQSALGDLPDLADDTLILVGDDAPGGLDLANPCARDLHVTFVATSSATTLWMEDISDGSMQITTSEVANPTVNDLDCGPSIDLDGAVSPFVTSAAELGFNGSIATEPGRRYWINFSAGHDDDVAYLFAINAEWTIGQRAVDRLRLAQDWAGMPLLADDTFILVGGGEGSLHPARDCGGDVHVSFIATEAVTPMWIADTDEVAFNIITSPVDNPSTLDLICGGWIGLDGADSPFSDGDLDTGFFGGLTTIPGERYWLSFSQDDGPEPFMLYPGQDPGARADLWELPQAADGKIITLAGADEYDVNVVGPCAGPVRMSFVATGAETTITRNDFDVEVAVFTSDQKHPAAADLDPLSCGSIPVGFGDLAVDTILTVPGQRYWIAARGDTYRDDVELVVDGGPGPLMSERFSLVQSTPLEGFTYLTPSAPGPADPIENCGVLQARFTARRADTTLWANSDIGSFAIYEAPIDPSHPDYERLVLVHGCSDDWSPPSAYGSFTTSFATVPGQDYWISWRAPENVVVFQDPHGAIDGDFADPIRVSGVRLESLRVEPSCENGAGVVYLPFGNRGPDTLDVTVDYFGEVVGQVILAPQTWRQVMRIEAIPNGPGVLHLSSAGLPLADLPIDVACETIDPQEWIQVPTLAPGETRIVGEDGQGLVLDGVYLGNRCFGSVVVQFVAQGTETAMWIQDTDEVIMQVITAGNQAPDPTTLGCSPEVYLDRADSGFYLADDGDGFYGSFPTNPGETYWLSFSTDDGPVQMVLEPAEAVDPPFDSDDWERIALLSGDQTRTVGGVTNDGLVLNGVRLGEPCYGFVNVQFVAQGTETAMWIEDTDEVIMQVITADDQTPDASTLRCSEPIFLDANNRGFYPADDGRGGFYGSFPTNPGNTYWLSFSVDDGPVEMSFVVDPDVEGPPAIPVLQAGGQLIEAVSSCSGGLMRMDVVIINDQDTDAIYVVEFQHASAGDDGEQRTFRKSSRVMRTGQSRVAITGRPNDVEVTADVYIGGEHVERLVQSRNCAIDNPLAGTADIVVSSSCLASNGFIRYALTNPDADARAWIVEFDGLPKRSTSAPGGAVGFGGISGRPDGDYSMTIRHAGDVVWHGQLTIDCDA